jgi:type IV pilus assembly protein PilA
MRKLRASRAGFTLTELMITVAIIGILAAIAIPNFVSYQNRSKRSEAMTNLEAVVKAEIAYFGANGVYRGTIGPMPAGIGPNKVPWDAAAKAEFDPLGYAPEGAVWYRYDVNTLPGDCACGLGGNGEAMCFTATANGDIDGDGFVAEIAYFHTDPVGGTCVTGGGNPPPTNPATGNLVLDTPVLIPVGAGSDDF